MSRKILHLDLDAFFCAVEVLKNPDLRGKPFAVGGKADQRGVVASCSYAARMFGVRSAMPMSRAKRLCPQLIVISSRHGAYRQMSKEVMARLDISPLVEQLSIDEAFIEVTGLPAPMQEIAEGLQRRINTELNLPVSIGGATNKLVAKIANDWGKRQKSGIQPPNAITIIHPGQEARFLAPLPVRSLWGVGPKTAEKLAGVGISKIGELAQTPPAILQSLFGRMGPELRTRAQGIDRRPIETEQDVKSISNEVTFARDLVDSEKLERAFRRLSEQVGRRLRKASLAGSTIQIKLRWRDFTTLTRQTTLPYLTNLDEEIFDTAMILFEENWPRGKPVRLIGVGVSNLGPPVRQMRLWDDAPEKQASLHQAVDDLRAKFGQDIIQRARRMAPRGETQSEAEENGLDS